VQQSTACLHFAWRTTSLRVCGRAARRSCLRSGGGRQAGATVLSCLVWRCKLNARQVCSASKCVRRSHCAARRRSLSVWRSSRLSSHSDNRHDKPVLSVSCLAWRCELATSRHVAQCLLLKVDAGTTAVVGPTTCTRGRRTCWRRDAWRPPAAHWPPTASTSATRRRSSWRCTAPEYTACTRSTMSHRSPQPSVLLLRPRKRSIVMCARARARARVCVCVCVFLDPRSCLQNFTSDFHRFCACYLRPWLGSPLTA